MSSDKINLEIANRLIGTSFEIARLHGHQPMTVCVVDEGGYMISAQRQDGSSVFRYEIAYGKAWTCIAMGHSTHFIEKTMSKNRPHFIDSLAAASHGRFIPALGGVLIRSREGRNIIGAIGATGDSGENDEAVVIEAVERYGFEADLT